MKKTYKDVIAKLIDEYMGLSVNFYYWDMRCDLEPHNQIWCSIRNDYSNMRDGIERVLEEFVSNATLEETRQAAFEEARIQIEGS